MKHVFGAKDTFTKEGLVDALKPYLVKLEFLAKGHKFAVSDHLNVADFTLAEFLETVRSVNSETLAHYPSLEA